MATMPWSNPSALTPSPNPVLTYLEPFLHDIQWVADGLGRAAGRQPAHELGEGVQGMGVPVHGVPGERCCLPLGTLSGPGTASCPGHARKAQEGGLRREQDLRRRPSGGMWANNERTHCEVPPLAQTVTGWGAVDSC